MSALNELAEILYGDNTEEKEKFYSRYSSQLEIYNYEKKGLPSKLWKTLINFILGSVFMYSSFFLAPYLTGQVRNIVIYGSVIFCILSVYSFISFIMEVIKWTK